MPDEGSNLRPRSPARGAGWGGPAKGAGWGPGVGPGHGPATGRPGQAFTEQGPAVLDNHDPEEQAYRAERRRIKRERRDNAWKALDALTNEPKHPSHFMAIRETLNRVEGVPVQKTEITGADGGPLQTVGIVTEDPVEAARVYQTLVNGSR